MRCLVDLRVEWVREDGPGFAGKTDMNAPLPFDLTTSFADVGPNVIGACVEPVAPRGLRGRPSVAKPSAFVERRRAASGTEEGLVRSPAVLGFVGVVWGLVLSAILTFGVSAGLALTGVSWMAAGYYCAAIILLVFGLVGIVLYWGTRAEHPSVAGMERYLEAAVERRRGPLKPPFACHCVSAHAVSGPSGWIAVKPPSPPSTRGQRTLPWYSSVPLSCVPPSTRDRSVGCSDTPP